jgi:hypothetical protein
LFQATIGLIEKSLCGNHRFGELAGRCDRIDFRSLLVE